MLKQPVRTQAIGVSEALSFGSAAISVRFYPEMKNAMGLDGLCIYYGGLCLANCVWGGISITDNRGKSLVKVEEIYHQKFKEERNEEVATCSTKL